MEHLIPPEWFAERSTFLLLLVGAFAVWLLVSGAGWLVGGASATALRAGMSKVIIGATIVSLGTTSPECAVSVMAAWEGDPGLALGNAVGSVIADTGLIFGFCSMLTLVPADRFILERQGRVQFGAALLLGGICYATWWLDPETPTLGRWVGFLFLTLLVGYLFASVRWGKEHPAVSIAEAEEALEGVRSTPWPALAGCFLFGLAVVIVSSHVVVQCAGEVAYRWGVPQVVIASTIVAFGTSLPELVIGVTAVRKGHPGLLLGNVIGADVLNVLFVIGASAAAAPLPVLDQGASTPAIFLYLHLPAMLAILVLFRLFIVLAVRRGRFHRWFGAPLLALYLLYIALNVLASR